MGNLLVGFHPSSFLPQEDRIHYHDNRLLALKPRTHDGDKLVTMRNFLNSWKTSKNEFFFLSYRAVQGAILGGIIGLTLFPAMKISPYVAHKLFNRISSSSPFPIDGARFLLGTIAPYFSFVGAVTYAGGTFLSEMFDRAFCANIAVKYGTLGAIDGILLCLLFGPVGSWTNGFLAGIITGLSVLGYKGIVRSISYGDFGNGCFYVGEVSEEEKERHRRQDERLGINFIEK